MICEKEMFSVLSSERPVEVQQEMGFRELVGKSESHRNSDVSLF